MPPVFDAKGNLLEQTKYGELNFENENYVWFSLSVLNSTFCYFFWLLYGDGFHVTKKLLGSVPLHPAYFSYEANEKIVEFGKKIQDEMEKHVVFKLNAGKQIGNYNLRLCRHLTNKVDQLIFTELGFSLEDLDDIYGFTNSMIKTSIAMGEND